MVPLTLEGSYALHQMMRFRGSDWKALGQAARLEIAQQASAALAELEQEQSALFSMLGHKGDLMWVHFRGSLKELSRVEARLAALRLWDYLEPSTSYLSVVELGLYESTGRIWKTFTERGLEPETDAWSQALEEEMSRQRKAMEPRLYPAIPPHEYLCFYPMDRKRGETNNWYRTDFAARARMMHEHGMVGRKYAGAVKQIITGSIGLDDWEWGVTLFSDDPVQFKKLIYEMRFDEVSAVYALFGAFYIGIRRRPGELAELLADGFVPASG